jgi:molybdopterin/thiamine biosynthesis adenylyltransferase
LTNLNTDNIDEWTKKCDVVLDGTDNFDTRPIPAAARYIADGEPKPPMPINNIVAFSVVSMSLILGMSFMLADPYNKIIQVKKIE